MKLHFSILLLVCIAIASCDTLKKSGQTEPFGYTYGTTSTDPSQLAFFETQFDSLIICVDPAADMQIMKWQSLTEKYYLLFRKGTATLTVSDGFNIDTYSGSELKAILPIYDYFLFSGDKMEDTKHNNIECESYNYFPTKDYQSFRKEGKNDLPIFPTDRGIPVRFYVSSCNNEYALLLQDKVFKPSRSDFDIPVSLESEVLVEEPAPKPETIDEMDVRIYGYVREKSSDEVLSNCHVVILKDGVEYKKVMTTCGGNYEFHLTTKGQYDLYFKNRGLVTKWLQMDFRNIPADNNLFDMELDGKLFKQPAGCDYDFTKEPVAKASYYPDFEVIQYDFEYTEMKVAEFDSVLSKYR